MPNYSHDSRHHETPEFMITDYSGHFLTENLTWSKDQPEAKIFNTIDEANKFAQENNIQLYQIDHN